LLKTGGTAILAVIGGAMPLFVFTGPEAGEKKTAVENIKKSLKKNAGVVEEYTFYASETEITDVVKLLLNESLFAAARFAVLHNAELIK
jgi:DNA polymerase-3 subunit delta